MPLLPSASDDEPVLILTDQDYQRAFTPEDPPEVEASSEPVINELPPSVRKASRPEPNLRALRRLMAAAIVAVLVAGAVLAWLELAPEPAAKPVVVIAPPKPVAKAPEPPPKPPKAPERAVVVPAPIEAEPPPVEEAPKPEPAPPAPAPPWNGGRAWVEVSLHMEYKGTVQDLRRKVVVVWEGSQFVVERPAVGRPETWMQRLELLLQLPQVGESWPRKVSKVSKDSVACANGAIPAERVEGEDRFPQETRRFTYWTAPEFGAGAIRAAVTFPDVSMELRVLAFGPEPETVRKP